jgi:hypothetical protein
MGLHWPKIQEDALEGFRILCGGVQTFFTQTLDATEQTGMTMSLHNLDTAIQARYRDVGESIYQQYTVGSNMGIEGDFKKQFEEIDRLLVERQHLLEEMKGESQQKD